MTKRLIFLLMLAGISLMASRLNAQTDAQANDSKSVLLWEGFESETFPPSGWTVVDVNDDFRTWFRGQDVDEPVIPCHTGDGCAVNLSTTNDGPIDPDDWIITPKVNIPATGSSVLSFYVGANQDYLNDICGVYVSTSNTAPSTFTLIRTETVHADPNIYYEITLPLDAYAGQGIYVGFRHFNSNNGYTLLLDDVSIENTPPSVPTFVGAATVDFGNVADTDDKQFVYTITNAGTADLEVSQLSASPELSLSGLPATIGYMQSAYVTVTLNSTTIENWSGNFVLGTNDIEHETVTVNVTANITSATASTYYYQDFESGKPAGWTYTGPLFELQTGSGVNNSTSFMGNVMGNGPAFVTGTVEMGAAPRLTFMYKAMALGGNTPAAADAVTVNLYITAEDGYTWIPVHTISPSGEHPHVPSADYALVDVDLSAYANQTRKIKLEAPGPGFGPPSFVLYVDNVGIGTSSSKDLAATSITGNESPTVGQTCTYTVSVQNNGSAEQSDYSVMLMNESDEIVDLEQGVSIAPNETKTFTFEWIPDTEGDTYLYGKVMMSGDEDASNNSTPHLNITVLPEMITGITLGTGTNPYSLPVNFYYKNSMVQTIYPASELGVNNGTISSISYYATTDADYTSPTVTFYIGETDKTNFDDGQYVDEAGMTQVFEGALMLPQGNSKVDIPFDAPYSYNGGNIVIYAVKNSSEGSDNKMFFGTATPGVNRSIEMYGSKGETKAPDSGYKNQTYPNITFYVNTSEMGKIAGVVSDAGGALEGVNVAIEGTLLYTTTDAEGKYEFAHLTPDEVTLRASLFGYHDATADATITAGVTTTVDITMTELPKVTVSGTVARSDNQSPISGAAVTLTGFDTYETVANASGVYSIEGVYANNSYEIAATADGYVDYTATVDVAEADVTHNVAMIETPLPVDGVTAEAGDAGATVAWWAPGTAPFVNTTYILDDSTFENSVGIQAYTTGSLGNKFVTEDAGRIQSIDIFGMTNAVSTRPLTVDIYNTDRELIGSSEPFIMPANDWINVPLFTGVEFSGDFYVMVKWPATEGMARMGFDSNGPNAAGNLSYQLTETFGWVVLGELGSSYNFVHAIRANAQVDKTEKSYGAAAQPVSHILRKPHSVQPAESMLDISEVAGAVFAAGNPGRIPSGAPKAIESYSVYRFPEGAPEAEWTSVATAVTDTTFTDAGWNSLEAGVYRYAVKTHYTNLTSTAVRSNALLKGMELEVTVNLTTNSDDAVNGAFVKLVNRDGDGEHIYTLMANNGTVVFPAVWKGTYDLSVVLEGFKPCNREVEVTDDMEIDVMLEEIIAKPYGLEVEVDGANASFSWTLENPFTDDMEGHDDFIIDNIGDYTLIDGDGAPTYIIAYSSTINYEFPHNGYTGSFIVMNPSQTVPSMTDMFTPHSGDKVLACMPVDQDFEMQNNDWLVLPKTKIADGMIMRFWAASVPSDYNLELIRVCVSTTGTEQDDFTPLHEAPFLTVPDEWTVGSFDLSDYDGQEVYLAINCVSHNSMMLLIDDIFVGFDYGETGKSFTNSTVYLNDTEHGTTQETLYEFTGLANGTYTAGVKSVYSSGESEIITSAPFEINVPDPEYTVTFNVTDEDGEPVEDATIVFNGETLDSYIASGVTAGEYNYTVSKDGYTTATGTVEVIDQNVTEDVILGTVGIDDSLLTDITIYGNEGNVYIVNKNSVTLKSVQILDVLGRVIYDGKASSSVTIPVNGASGIYVVKLLSDDNKTSSTKVHLTR